MSRSRSPQMRQQMLGLFTNKWAILCFSILAFQQMMEASATLWLVSLMKSVASGEIFYPYLVLYLASLAIPYIPWCVAQIIKITWKQESLRSFINTFVESNKNNISVWNNQGLKEQKLSILTSEGPTALHALIDYVWDLYTYLLSVFFNILALSIVVEPLLAMAYGISITCVIIVMKLKLRAQRQLTQKALSARIDLCQSLLAAWDNVLLGNEYNFHLWEEKTNQRVNRCLQRNVALERFDQLLAIFVSVMTSIPCLVVMVHYIIKHQSDPVELSSFLVILPLLFMILSYTYQTLTLAFRWTMHRSKLKSIYRTIQGASDLHAPLEKKVNWHKMTYSNSNLQPNDQLSHAAPFFLQSQNDLLHQAARAGRVTIRGENGCGKSTALVLIKNALGKRAFFLPTHSTLSFQEGSTNHSTGESLKHRLIEILDRVNADVLLLDEWDANLDKENQERLSTLIDELAMKKCVIEVRHR